MTASPYEARLDSLRRFLGGAQEGVLLSDEVNIGYFTGFFHSEGYLLVTQNSAALLVDFRYYEAAQRQAAGCKVVCSAGNTTEDTDGSKSRLITLRCNDTGTVASPNTNVDFDDFVD